MTNDTYTSDPDDENDRFEHWLQSRLNRWDCPDPDTLGDYYLGHLPVYQQGMIEAHLRECVRCREELALLADFINQADEQPAPQTALSAHSLPPWQPDVVAQMSRSAHGASIRGAGDLQARFSFDLPTNEGSNEHVELLLSVSQQIDSHQLNGLLSMSETAEALLVNALVEIWQAEALLATVFIDDLGGFSATLPSLESLMLRITIKGQSVFTGQVEFE